LGREPSPGVNDGMVDLRTVIQTSLGGGCSHEPVCDAVHRVLDPDSPSSDSYCCRMTGSLCEAIYDAYYEVRKSDDRAEAIFGAVQCWIIASFGR
jgi:hypothetical protein